MTTTGSPGVVNLRTVGKGETTIGVACQPGTGTFDQEADTVHAIVTAFARSVKQQINFFPIPCVGGDECQCDKHEA